MRDAFVTVARYNYSSEAQIIKGRLEADGIDVFLSDQFTIDTDPLVSQAIGGVKLKVRKEDSLKAQTIIKQISKYSLNDEGEAINCPSCSSNKVELFSTINSFKSLIAFLVGLLFGSLPFYTTYEYKCEACHTKFNLK